MARLEDYAARTGDLARELVKEWHAQVDGQAQERLEVAADLLLQAKSAIGNAARWMELRKQGVA